MAFGMFKKKKEVVDLRPKDADMPIPAKMRERLLPAKSNIVNTASANSQAESGNSSSGGGFFGGFFGGGSSSDSISTVKTSAPEAKTDFWGNPISTNNTDSSSNSDLASSSNNESSSQIGEIAYKLSRFTDRLELIEKKIDRLQRKLGITSGSD